MLALSDSCRYFLYRPACDMRRSFYTLAGMVREQMQGDPLSGDIFIFLSRRRNQVKLLRWEGDGFALYSKRLEEGTFEMPEALDEGSFLISHKELLLILQGISLKQVRYRKRYASVKEC
ncbi:IS66 family insertion sequence element accessory protein TnpB [Paraflavisolibacter sp. H34]|uniref:IS66 family insertion sequence element accessory protein TnpB n=1 Tax=Huijunlia imazamoxiresistens TaxID=3127457 RepID=UPI003016FCF8